LSGDRRPRLFVSAGLPGIGGRIKSAPEDFRVDEVPSTTPAGRGEFVWIRVEKRRLSTPEAVAWVARRLRVPASQVRSAGLKDASAVASQWLSVRGRTPADVAAASADLESERLRVLDARAHTRAIRVGELAGNRFEARVRGVVPDALTRARAILAVLEARGVPNYYGPQRYGRGGDNHLFVEDLVRRGARAALQRAGGESGDEEDAAAAGRNGPNRGPAESAVARLPRTLLWLYISAFQSALFDKCVTARLDGPLGIDALRVGDLALDRRTRMVYEVGSDESASGLRERAAAFEATATGPIVGERMVSPSGEPGRLEASVLEPMADVTARLAHLFPGVRPTGTRRALRFRVEDLDVREAVADGELALDVAFFLESGAYATTFLRELTKAEPAAPPAAPESIATGDDEG